MGAHPIEIVSRNMQEVEDILATAQDRLAATLPRSIPPSQFILVAMDLIRGTPTLAKCMETSEGRLSIVKSIFEASDMGLLLTKHLGHGYLVPFKNDGISEAQLIIGYRGFCHLIQKGDSNARSPYSVIVWPGENFQYNGPEQLPFHEYSTQGGIVEYDAQHQLTGFVGCYAVVSYKDGSHRCEWMPLHEIEAIRNRSKAKDNGPWISDPAEMVKKTPLRRMAKWLPLTPEITAGIVRDEYREAGVDQASGLPAPISMPKRRSETSQGFTSSAQGGNGAQTHSQGQGEDDFSADLPPTCPVCEAAMKFIPSGYSNRSMHTYPAFYACENHKDAKHKKAGSKTINASEWHKNPESRPPEQAAAAAPERDPGQEG